MEAIRTVVSLLSVLQVAWSLDNGLGLVPAMGWNTWCTLGTCGRDYCDAQEIMEIADAMASNGMKELGYEYINLDDCWADKRTDDGTIVPDKSRFPNGLMPVIEHVKSKGLKFGLYTDAGIYTCSQGGRDHKIPGSYGYYEQDAKTYAEWGVEYVKMDWCNTKVNGTTLDPKVQYAQMSEALNKTGKSIFFNACEWGVEDPWEWMAQFANSWRSGPDHHDDWGSTSKIIEVNADKGKYAGPGGWNDADFIMTGGQGCKDNTPMVHCPGQTDEEYRTEFTLWSIMGSSLIVSTDIRNMTSIMKEVGIALFQICCILLSCRCSLIVTLLRLIKILRQKVVTELAHDCPQGSSYCQIWARELNDGYVVALYNSGSNSSDIEMKLTLINLDPPVTLTDLWTDSISTVSQDSFRVTVDSHQAKAFKIKKQ